MTTHAVVMICGPHHPKFSPDGSVLCHSFHQGTRCFSRIDHATMRARRDGAPLIVAGDANGGLDVQRYTDHARAYGVQAFSCVWDGVDPPASNTLLDVRMAIETLLQSSFLFQRFILVTDGWHIPRAMLLAMAESKRLCAQNGRALLDVSFDACAASWQPPEELLMREKAGAMAIAAGTYGQGQDLYTFGKPVLETRVRTG